MSFDGIDESKMPSLSHPTPVKQGHQPIQGASTPPGQQGQQQQSHEATASLYPVHQLKQAENDSQVGSMFDQDIGTVYV